MDVNAELKLSFYREIAMLNEAHGVVLVQHIESKKIFVKKVMEIYDLDVFQHLMAHPVAGVPKIEELVETGKRLYVIEEYISGVSLRERLDSSGTLPVDVAQAYLGQLCDILRPLHQLSPPIVHRDIKPSNIIITSAGQLYLVDFNSAKKASTAKEQDTVLIGTVGYAAPEQYGFSASQPTADIYALGVLFNEMLTGNKPQEELPAGRLAAVIKKCVQMEPSNRYQSVDELLKAVDSRTFKPPIDLTKIRPWLLPGFRTNKPLRWVMAIMWYVSIILVSSSAIVKDAGPLELTIFRIFYFICFFVETLWFGNYRGVWKHLPLTSHPNRVIRALSVVGWAFILLCIIVIFMAILTLPL